MAKIIPFVLIVLVASFGFANVAMAQVNGNNTSEVYKGASYEAIKVKMQNYRYAMQMDMNASKMMDQSEANSRAFFHEYYQRNPLIGVDETISMAQNKVLMAKQNSGYANMQFKTNYDYQVNAQKLTILNQLKHYLSNGRNSAPAFVSCEAWHNCAKPVLTSNSEWKMENVTKMKATIANSTIPLKPEFQTHPSGIVQNNSTVKNWNDLQQYMTQNKTK